MIPIELKNQNSSKGFKMNERLIKYTGWFLIIMILQVFIFREINFGWGEFYYVSILFYPIFVLILPINMPRTYIMLLGFLMGFILDLFYLSPGIHSASLVFTAFFRTPVLNILEPRGGYKVNSSPTIYHMGLNWFLLYVSVLLFIHHLIYFFIEIFAFDLFLYIWLKTIFSFIFSLLFVMAFVIILNPKY